MKYIYSIIGSGLCFVGIYFIWRGPISFTSLMVLCTVAIIFVLLARREADREDEHERRLNEEANAERRRATISSAASGSIVEWHYELLQDHGACPNCQRGDALRVISRRDVRSLTHKQSVHNDPTYQNYTRSYETWAVTKSWTEDIKCVFCTFKVVQKLSAASPP